MPTASRPPRAWSPSELDSARANARKLDRSKYLIGGVPAADWWEAFVLVSYDTALRTGDALNLEFANLAADGTLLVTVAKTGQTLALQLHPDTLAAIERIRMPERSRIFPWTTRLQFGRCFRRLFRPSIITGREGGAA